MPIAFDPEFTIQDSYKVLLSGTATDNSADVERVDLYTQDGLLGAATLLNDGSWIFADYPPSVLGSPFQLVSATLTNSDGDTETTKGFVALGVDAPSPSQLYSGYYGENTFNAVVYGPQGRPIYDVYNVDDADVSQGQIAIGRGGRGINYGFFEGYSETLGNFRVAGPRHDSLDFSESQFSNVAQVLRHTTNEGGSATVHFDDGSFLAIEGVSKQQLASHRQDFSFG